MTRSTTRKPPDDGCTFAISGSHRPTTLEDIARYADLAVYGRVVDVLPSQWNTADGQPPVDTCTINMSQTYIFTPFVIDLYAPAFINTTSETVSGGQIVVAMYGGVVGTSTMLADTSQAFHVGAEVVLTLSTSPPFTDDTSRPQTARGQAWHVRDAFDVQPDGTAVARHASTPDDTTMSVADLIAGLTAAAVNATTPTPSP